MKITFTIPSQKNSYSFSHPENQPPTTQQKNTAESALLTLTLSDNTLTASLKKLEEPIISLHKQLQRQIIQNLKKGAKSSQEINEFGT